ncbi:MAG: hypothetical protein WCL50_05425 [Spirochaetota bacterium]
MEGIRHILSRKTGFLPKTQAQALAALLEGLVEESVFVWKAVNIHPVFEEPWDFNEIERLLAKEDLAPETTLLLMTIFERLIRDPDKERALFAAESINAIERRFARKARALREDAAKTGSSAPLPTLAALYRDFGMASFARPILKRFYLGEALAVIGGIPAIDAGPGPAIDRPALAALEIGILLELGESERAGARIGAELAARPDDRVILLLSARYRYERRDWRGVMRVLEPGAEIDEGQDCTDFASVRDFWTGGACHD